MNFRLKITVIMVLFAIVISFTIATVDYLKLKEQFIEHNQFQVQQIEETVKYSLKTIEKAYFLFGEDLATKMEAASHFVIERYQENPHLDQWDFQKLKDALNFDIYMINQQNVITHSSLSSDLGLDFTVCCKKLVPILEKRRASGEFYADGMDIEQHTGVIKKYSYMATPDKKYLIQLGISLEDGRIFKEFNFLKTMNDLVQRYPSVYAMNVLNIGGYALGEPVLDETKLPQVRRKAFEQTLSSKETIEIKGEWRGEPAIFRYVHYVSNLDTGTTKNKVLEIVYNEKELQLILDEQRKTFIWRLAIVLIITIFLSFIVSNWVARFMYLAFHDSLTGLKNRAAFDELLASILQENKGNTALLLIDLDNFKLVNDRLGHKTGDELLKAVAYRMKSIVRKEDILFRWGGDEFAIVMPITSKAEAEQVAKGIIENLQDLCTQRDLQFDGEKISVSMGIAIAPVDGVDPESFHRHADQALYRSKEKGKNQYQFYNWD